MTPKRKSPTLRAAVVACHFWPENIAMAIRSRYLVEALVNHGFDTSVYTSTPAGSEDMPIRRIVNSLPPPSNMDGHVIRLLKEILFGIETFFRLLFSRHDVYIVT